MQRSRTMVIAAVALLLAGAGAFFLSRKEKTAPAPAAEPSDVVMSNDGRALLDIPKGALPEGTRLDEVKVTALSKKEVSLLSEKGSPAAGYRLEPEGLVLTKPATARVRGFLGADGSLPLLSHVHEGKVALVADMLAMVDGDTTETMVQGSIGGFSTIYISSGLFDVTIDVPSVAAVGQDFQAKAVTRQTGTGRKWLVEDALRGNTEVNPNFEHVLGKASVQDPWTLRGEWTTQNALSPRSISDRPPATAVTGSFTANGTFRCTRPGGGNVEYRGSVTATVKTAFDNGYEMTTDPTFPFVEFRNVLCQGDVAATTTTAVMPGTFAVPDYWMQGFASENMWIGYTPPGKIRVIAYGGKYLPVSGLEVRTGPDCEAHTAPHWHAIGGIVTALDGSAVIDPGSCAFGKVRENPAILIDDPKTVPDVDDIF